MPYTGVVTGANRGLGFCVAQQLASTTGVRVILAARSLDAAAETVARIRKLLPNADVIPCSLDVTSEESVRAFARWAAEECKDGLDFVVNNAGFAYPGDSAEVPFAKQAADTLSPNYFGTVRTTRALLPQLRPGGRVVNVASTSGLAALMMMTPALQERVLNAEREEDVAQLMEEFLEATREGVHQERGFPGNAYGVSKLGLLSFTRVLARSGVLSCCVCPGWCLTDMASEITRTSADASMARTTEEGAQDIAFLALPPELGGDPRGAALAGKFVRPQQPYVVKMVGGIASPWVAHELPSLAHGGRMVPPEGGRSSL